MKTWQGIKKWLTGGCVYFTAVSLILIFLQLSMSGSSDAGGIQTGAFLLLFPFGLCMSAASMLIKLQTISAPLRRLFHFLITVISLYVFLYLPANFSVSPSTALIMLALIVLLYWILLGIVTLIRSRIRKLMQED